MRPFSHLEVTINNGIFYHSVFARDEIKFQCNGKNVVSIEYTYAEIKNFPPLKYSLTEWMKLKEGIIGTLDHDLVVTGGNCFHLKVKTNDTEIVSLNQQTTAQKLEPDFSGLHLCQDIVMERSVEYKERKPYEYRQGDVDEAGNSMKGQSGYKCYHTVNMDSI